jgi:hypothetical protein
MFVTNLLDDSKIFGVSVICSSQTGSNKIKLLKEYESVTQVESVI